MQKHVSTSLSYLIYCFFIQITKKKRTHQEKLYCWFVLLQVIKIASIPIFVPQFVRHSKGCHAICSKVFLHESTKNQRDKCVWLRNDGSCFFKAAVDSHWNKLMVGCGFLQFIVVVLFLPAHSHQTCKYCHYHFRLHFYDIFW